MVVGIALVAHAMDIRPARVPGWQLPGRKSGYRAPRGIALDAFHGGITCHTATRCGSVIRALRWRAVRLNRRIPIMSAVIVTGDDRAVVATLTIDKSTAKAGEALGAAVLVKACLLNLVTRATLTPVYVIAAEAIDATAGTVSVTVPAIDSAGLDPAISTVMEIEATDGDGKKITWTDLGPILIKRGAIT